jgi:hypothetical protein
MVAFKNQWIGMIIWLFPLLFGKIRASLTAIFVKN